MICFLFSNYNCLLKFKFEFDWSYETWSSKLDLEECDKVDWELISGRQDLIISASVLMSCQEFIRQDLEKFIGQDFISSSHVCLPILLSSPKEKLAKQQS